MAEYQKVCEWCNKEFVAKLINTKTCTESCRRAKWKMENIEKIRLKDRHRNKERMKIEKYRLKQKERMNEYRIKNKDKIKDYKKEYYDSGGFLASAKNSKKHEQKRSDPVLSDPVLYEKELTRKREFKRSWLKRKKLEADRMKYIGDPINARRIAEANFYRMTPEEKEQWHQKREDDQEKADRKERRKLLKKELAAQDLDASAITSVVGDAFAHLELDNTELL